MKQVAVEGLDGTGKTSVAGKIATIYRADGLNVEVVAPYRRARERLGEDLYPLWKSTRGALMAISVMRGVFGDINREAQDKEVDVIIYDRHWMTAFSEIATRPELVEAWGDMFVPTAYLRVDPEVARRRATNDAAAPWMERHNFAAYAARYEALCDDYSEHLLGIYRNDDDVALSSIARSIVWDGQVRR